MMRRLARMLCVWLCVPAGAALAHSPYFSDPLDCPAPGGEAFRFLYGDGLFGPDPMAITALDSEGRLLAFQDVGTMSVLVVQDGGCRVVDWQNGTVWQRSDGVMDAGEIVLGEGEDVRNALWAFEPGQGREGFGFAAASLDTVPLARRLAAEARQRWRAAGAVVGLTCLALVLLWAVFALPRALHWGWRVGLAAVGVAGAAVLAMPVIVVQVLMPLSPPVVVGTVAVALAIALLLRLGLLRLSARRLRGRAD